MPSPLTYPGVYIEELPSAVRTITGVPTSITAFVGRAWKGPVDEPVRVNSYADYERIFGGLWRESTMSYAVYQFFLNGGSQGVIVRVATRTGGTAAAVATVDLGGGTALEAASV
jgi:phage tail sheath protein FI